MHACIISRWFAPKNQPKCNTNSLSLVQCQTNYRHTLRLVYVENRSVKEQPKIVINLTGWTTWWWWWASWLYIAPGGRREQSNNPFFIPIAPTSSTSPLSSRGERDDACACALHAYYTHCSTVLSGGGPYTVGPNDKATKKVQRTEAAVALRFSVAVVFPWVHTSMMSSVATRRATHKARIEVRNPIKMLQPYFLLVKTIEFPILWYNIVEYCHFVFLKLGQNQAMCFDQSNFVGKNIFWQNWKL